jgi:CheY-like chemotaxis protein
VRALIVEDDALIRLMIEDFLTDLGCEVVATASRLGDAIQKASALAVDVTVLDLNLAGNLSYPVGQALVARGIPFVFVTGYRPDRLPAEFHTVPLVTKPFELPQLARALNAALQRPDPGLTPA